MNVRKAARLIVIEPSDTVLFFEAVGAPLDLDNKVSRYWYLPGGAVERGESFEQAARRELWEETGYAGIDIGPCVWIQEHVLDFPITGRALAHERFFPVRVPHSQLSFINLVDDEATVLESFRWWSRGQLMATSEVMFPTGIAVLVDRIIAGEFPDEPIWLS